MTGFIGFVVKLLISVVVMATFVLPAVDWSKPNALETLIFPLTAFPWLVYALLTLYFDKPRAIERDATGLLVPIYEVRSKQRNMIGMWLFWGDAVASVIAIQFLPATELADIVMAAFTPPLILGGYLLLTPRCKYCYRANVPKEKKCAGCGTAKDNPP